MPGAIPDFGMPGATRVSLDSMVVPGAVPVFAFPGSLHDGRRDAQQGAVRYCNRRYSRLGGTTLSFPVFATYLIPAASPPPLRGGAKSASNPFARARKPHTWFFSLSGSVALPGFTLMPARSGFAWQPQMLSWHLLRRLVLCHRSPTWFRMLTAHRFLFYFSLVCLPVALQVSILAAQLDVAEGGAPHSQSARVPLSSSSASSC